MDKNKSIDGLAPRRSKKSAATTSISLKKSPKRAATSTTKPASRSSAKKAPSTTTRKKSTSSTNNKTTKPTNTRKATSNKSVNKPKTPIFVEPPKKTTQEPAEPLDTTPEQITASDYDSETEITEDFLKPTQVFNFDEESGELKASDETFNDKSKKKPKKAKKPVSKKRKIITSIILFFVLILLGGIIWLVIWGNDIIAKITGGQGNIFDLIRFNEPTYERLKTDENGRTNILAFGTSGYNMEGDEGNGTHSGAQLTDSIMVISLNQDSGDIAMVSLPRDLKASPTCTATGKINEVYWCNGGGGSASTEEESTAAQALMDEVGTILDIDFQYYAHINWASLIDIVNILDSITIRLDEGIYDYYYTGAVFDPDVDYTINGDQALGLARARHGTTGGDFSRGNSQQKILIGIKNKLMEKDLSITDYLGLASTLGDNLRTNFSIDELKSIAHLTFDFDFDSMRQVSLLEPTRLMTTGSINGISYVLPSAGAGNYAAIQAYVAKMFSNDPRVYEDSTILVLNATEAVGIASTEKATLEEDGYSNVDADNAPAGITSTDKYTLYSTSNDAPGTKKLLEEKYSVSAKPVEELPAEISHDYTFILILGGEEESANNND